MQSRMYVVDYRVQSGKGGVANFSGSASVVMNVSPKTREHRIETRLYAVAVSQIASACKKPVQRISITGFSLKAVDSIPVDAENVQ